MISINDVDCEFLWNGSNSEFTEDIKKCWNSMSEQERSKYFTTVTDRIEFSANQVLRDLFEQAEENYGIDDMFDGLWFDTTDDFINRFQEMLNEISEFKSAKFLTTADEIDPTIDLEEVEE
jgi:hypothetical protein